jgi:D-tagatose-1,6-bisphosphate aldolase subunit GatZ/KbaZ
MNAAELMRERFSLNKNGSAVGVYSVCSAHRTVLEAAMLQAEKDNSFLLIESTSNQVDQYGGYTGMKPADFATFIRRTAQKNKFPFERIILGGDHLGPNSWQSESAESAMAKARLLVKGYVEAGYRKIHLDTSMFCADDLGDRYKPLADEIVAERAAELCQVCEDCAGDMKEEDKPLYVIGTEVPVPGGARQEASSVPPTLPENLCATLEITKRAFYDAGLEAAWGRVIAAVVQPGVEFGDNQVFYYRRENARMLSAVLESIPLVFEVHSTDYQTERCLTELVEDHFCILKVGPWLTFAYREALFALEQMEAELIRDGRSRLSDTAEAVMLEELPNYWWKYYQGSDEEQHFKRRFSFSDRIRYYWPDKRLAGAVEQLYANLERIGIPLSLLSQYMPMQFMPVSEGLVTLRPRELVKAHIRNILGVYAQACGWK